MNKSENTINFAESRVTLVGIMVENTDSVARVNGLLHEYGSYIIGRMGIPYPAKKVNVISVVMDAPQSVVSALSGKLGMLPGVTGKCLYGKK
ncbi:MAG: iron-only hydrogenase system regulator [Bacteroidales bacterium]|nr:iron-only hydrogenase system regulator [Lachnoclostridium sp.]MCM1383302.1 iron-only hydrogenase system regulator [Lachnoclostridium sp.]MCM1464966.1 iron-only hydrogenase system regulator [Bacteroidales bacterium]